VSNAGKFQGLPAEAKAGKVSSNVWQTIYACGRKAGDPKSVAWGLIDHRTMRAIRMHRNGPAIMRAMVMRIVVLPHVDSPHLCPAKFCSANIMALT